MKPKKLKFKIGLALIFSFLLSSCDYNPFSFDPFNLFENGSSNNAVRDIGGSPANGARDIYESADLTDLCVDHSLCEPDYDPLTDDFIQTDNQEPLEASICNFDYDPNTISTLILNRVDGSVNGLKLLLSKEDIFFLAWVAVRLQINPYFLMGVLSQESSGNCAAVSNSNGEGCFQITNTFGQGQLNDSYPDRVESWFWSSRSGEYYPDNFFEDSTGYFGVTPDSDQFRMMIDPTSATIDDTTVSSVVNFHFGVIASGLYYRWQEYLLYTSYEGIRSTASDIFQSNDGKAIWQAAAYNGGAYGAAQAIESNGADFLEALGSETQNYAPVVVDYCHEYQAGTLTYSASYSQDDVDFLIDLLQQTYSSTLGIDWNAVKDDVHQTFFADGTTELTFVDDIKALIYVISTKVPELAPEWPEEDSI